MSNAAKNFDILTTSLSVLYNYFDNPIKLFSDLYLVKFLNTSAKLFFPCIKISKKKKDYYKIACNRLISSLILCLPFVRKQFKINCITIVLIFFKLHEN